MDHRGESLTSVNGGAVATYVYDGDGRRVKGTAGGATTCPGGTYTRDLAGNTLSLPLCHLSEFAMLGEPHRGLLPVVQVAR